MVAPPFLQSNKPQSTNVVGQTCFPGRGGKTIGSLAFRNMTLSQNTRPKAPKKLSHAHVFKSPQPLSGNQTRWLTLPKRLNLTNFFLFHASFSKTGSPQPFDAQLGSEPYRSRIFRNHFRIQGVLPLRRPEAINRHRCLGQQPIVSARKNTISSSRAFPYQFCFCLLLVFVRLEKSFSSRLETDRKTCWKAAQRSRHERPHAGTNPLLLQTGRNPLLSLIYIFLRLLSVRRCRQTASISVLPMKE